MTLATRAVAVLGQQEGCECMTYEEMVHALYKYCSEHKCSENCELYRKIPLTEPCVVGKNVERNYEIVFEKVADNPYWKAIEALAERQRAKGISKYGQGLEMNPMGIIDRLTYLEEELVDGLFYIEHIKAWIMENMAHG